jgi:hypothetical protein
MNYIDFMNPQRTTPKWITSLQPDEVFVFGSNLQGLHAGGAAKLAMQWGAVWGKGVGLQGQTYAIPTMQGGVDTIRPYVDEFISLAKQHPNKTFLVTEIGCGIAGFTVEQIAPLFKKAVDVENIYLPERFWTVLC